MRKCPVILLLLVLALSVEGQSLPKDSNGKINYSDQIKIDSSDADELFRRAKTWVLENFKNLGQVLQKDDPRNHQIVLNGKGECYAEKSFGDTIENLNHSYILRIDVGEDGYSYTLTDFMTTDKWKGEMPAEQVKYGKKAMQEHEAGIAALAATLIASLKNAMSTKIVVGRE